MDGWITAKTRWMDNGNGKGDDDDDFSVKLFSRDSGHVTHLPGVRTLQREGHIVAGDLH